MNDPLIRIETPILRLIYTLYIKEKAVLSANVENPEAITFRMEGHQACFPTPLVFNAYWEMTTDTEGWKFGVREWISIRQLANSFAIIGLLLLLKHDVMAFGAAHRVSISPSRSGQPIVAPSLPAEVGAAHSGTISPSRDLRLELLIVPIGC